MTGTVRLLSPAKTIILGMAGLVTTLALKLGTHGA